MRKVGHTKLSKTWRILLILSIQVYHKMVLAPCQLKWMKAPQHIYTKHILQALYHRGGNGSPLDAINNVSLHLPLRQELTEQEGFWGGELHKREREKGNFHLVFLTCWKGKKKNSWNTLESLVSYTINKIRKIKRRRYLVTFESCIWLTHSLPKFLIHFDLGFV